MAADTTPLFSLMRGDRPRARASVSELARIVRDHDLPVFRAFGEFLVGWATIDDGALADGLEAMRHGAESLRRQNVVVYDGLVKIALAEAEVRAGDLERALKFSRKRWRLATAWATARTNANSTGRAANFCSRAIPLIRPAEEAFQTAIAIARRQGARSVELRARRLRSPSSTNRPAAPPTPTPSSPPLSKAFRRRRRCSRSKRR